MSSACLVPALLGGVRGMNPVISLLLGYTLYSVAAFAAAEFIADPHVTRALRIGDVLWTAALALLSRGAFTSLLVAMVILGLVASYSNRRSAQAAIASELLAGIQAQRGFRLAMKYGASELMRRTGSDTFLVAARELDSTRALLWSASLARGDTVLLLSSDLPRERQAMYFFEAPGVAWAVRRRERGRCSIEAVGRQGDTVDARQCDVSPAFWQFHPRPSAVVVEAAFGGAWRGRLFLLRKRAYSRSELRFIQRTVRQIMPALHNQYLWRRLRSEVAGLDRRRVARQLHDGVIQSLVGLQMQTAAVRRRLAGTHPEVDTHLARVQETLGDEARAVRDVMHHVSPIQIAPGQFVPALGEIVERFERDTGIRAQLYAGPQDTYVPPRVARLLARTLQEALSNVRRHSGAEKVDVEFRADAEAWRLDIENNGRPFKFLGRLSLEELDARRLGPRAIKERVRDMDGDLTIESSPTSGVRLEISLPRREGQYKSA
jgi:signal transduction histidine kinase